MNRLISIDILRGFIMMLMAIDHASALVARVHFTEIWGVTFKGYLSAGWWFARFISHLCAPGFFFLMGVSMVLFANKQLQNFWTVSKIQMYFIKRAGVILLLMFFIELPAWALGMSFNEVRSDANLPGLLKGSFLIPTSVLFGLSASMFIAAFLWSFNKLFLLVLTASSFILSTCYIVTSNPEVAFHPLTHMLLVPGMSDGILILYPIIPWIGVTAFGMCWAKLYVAHQSKIFKYTLFTGVAFIGLFFILRFLGLGNFQYNNFHSWIDFFTLIKYPPSIIFILFTMGVNLILLFVFNKLKAMPWLKPAKIFGQTAMFFYLIHLYFYAVIGIAFPTGCNIVLMYGLWFFGLIVLYFVCQSFLLFKRQKPTNSIWKML